MEDDLSIFPYPFYPYPLSLSPLQSCHQVSCPLALAPIAVKICATSEVRSPAFPCVEVANQDNLNCDPALPSFKTTSDDLLPPSEGLVRCISHCCKTPGQILPNPVTFNQPPFALQYQIMSVFCTIWL